MPSVKDVDFISSYRSYYSTIVLSLEINEFKNGKGLWKFNTSLPKDKIYSRTSIARTLMARLPWLFRTRS